VHLGRRAARGGAAHGDRDHDAEGSAQRADFDLGEGFAEAADEGCGHHACCGQGTFIFWLDWNLVRF